MKIQVFKIAFISILLISLNACSNEVDYVPKPHAYPRVMLPVKTYSPIQKEESPYQFEIPQYASIVEDKSAESPFWYNVEFPVFDATLHFTYYNFKNNVELDSMITDTRSLVYKHLQKAEDIIEDPVNAYNPNLRGLIYHIQGNTATNLNFYATDSSQNFLRGALYFNQKTDKDSVLPIYQYLMQDVQHILKTLTWK